MKNSSDTSSRQVIFVGGTSYSGSTMLDMMLTHGPGGFSCGEVAAVYSPYRHRHLTYENFSNEDGDTPWRQIISSNPDELYEAIFAANPQVTRIIDSSKDPIWIHDRMAALRRAGTTARSVLIWKSPAEFAESRWKRGRRSGWKRSWMNYHRLYFRLISDWASISYRSLTADSRMLSRLCDELNVPYFPGKEEYWLGSYQTLFGNTSAKIHLSDSDTGPAKHIEAHAITDDDVAHRKIYYSAPGEEFEHINSAKEFKPVLKYLTECDDLLRAPGSKRPPVPKELLCSTAYLRIRYVRKYATSSLFRFISKTTGKTP